MDCLTPAQNEGESVSLRALSIGQDIIKQIPAQFASHYKVIPIDYKGDVLTIAAAHPQDIHVIDGIGLITPARIKMVPASETEIAEAIRKYYGVGAATIDRMMGAVHHQKKAEREVEDIKEISSEASIGKFINQILLQAYKDRATDIHLEPFEDELKVRYRIDGVLYDTRVPSNLRHFKDTINSRIKIMSHLDIAEKRLPQDGRFRVKVGEVDLDLRVSFLPTQYGESAVIRILTSAKLYNLQELGLSPQDEQMLNGLIRKPHGIIFVTGPTGSGKTTTLYSCLSHVNRPDKKIITIEDPVEYQINGITQIQINPAIEFTFARGLRSMLRHDPDIMMVGEVRDLETAQIATRIALTGHLVFSTLHTNDAASGITRLVDMGVEPYLITSSVECFVAQRLIRLICPECRIPVKSAPDIIKKNTGEGEKAMLYEGRGCGYCNFTGYHGREGIYEFLPLNDEIRELVLIRASSAQIKKKAAISGFRTLAEHGWQKVRAGRTTPAEIIRVTQEDAG